MQFKTILLGTAALALMAGSAAAQDAPKKHHHHHAAAANGSIDARIDQLEAEIHDLKRQQHEQAQAQAQVAAAAPAPSDQQVSQAQFEALQNQVYEQQASNTSLTKGSWWSNTKISGRMYYDITNIDNKADGVKGAQDGFNFDIKRFYLGVDHQFDDVFSANLTTDFTYDGTTKASQLYIKKAYLQAKLNDAFTFRLGSTDLPWVPFMEDLYGYRYVENTLIDRTKFGTSADWGVHLLGKFADGLIGYQISAINGAGYKAHPGRRADLPHRDALRCRRRLQVGRPESRRRIFLGGQLEQRDHAGFGQGRRVFALRVLSVHAGMGGVRTLRLDETEQGHAVGEAQPVLQFRYRIYADEDRELRARVQA